mmetsp:Transcript_16776/g.29907  ORF Transcript_16776/g.29907 Transcript_16776/m.29907 type:complete len:118 (-) Transcript_16776:142-495(-)|eukprot:CAMPEP_0177763664 /NCGR_PEP_ID=MMETSP0491_2-20121128/6988_1 /TAXON_ID=63592 /ORGANISM="Tetraselmis chuii, Strain PLY429" /LENGTH=117 /DNA_ID=CAMNT_0019279779 /DNA_START=49 /DNA_END=405 /DNA_ORIENTATION=+
MAADRQATPAVLQFSDSDKEKLDKLLEDGHTVVIDFTAQWCVPCKQISPFFEKLCAEHGHKLQFVKIDVDESEELAREYAISAMPTFQVLTKEGKQAELVGASKDKLEEFVKKFAAM